MAHKCPCNELEVVADLCQRTQSPSEPTLCIRPSLSTLTAAESFNLGNES